MAILTSPKIRFSIADYLRISEAGVFDDRRVELLGGRILQMHAQATGGRKDWQYLAVEHFQGNQIISLLDRPEITIAVEDIIP